MAINLQSVFFVVAHQKHKNNRSLVNVVHVFSRFFTKPASVDRKRRRNVPLIREIIQKTFKLCGRKLLGDFLLFIFIIQLSYGPSHNYRTWNTWNNKEESCKWK